MNWTPSILHDTVAIIRSSKTVQESVNEIVNRHGPVTWAAVKRAFLRHGLEKPETILGADRPGNTDGVGEAQSGSVTLGKWPSVEAFDRESHLQKILFIPDTHCPYHDPGAWSLAMRVARAIRPDILVILGDFADFYSVSSYSKSPARRDSLKWEVEETNKLLDEVDALGVPEKHFIAGNHEFRLERFLQEKARELYGLVDTQDLLRLRERGYRYTPYKQMLKLGKLNITHDVGDSGANAHTKAGQKVGGNIVIGHVHRAAISYFGTTTGQTHVCASMGWLGSFDAIDYMSKEMAATAWMHGVGLAYMEPSGNAHVSFIPFINGSAVVEGRLV